jgi:hypothetical protein
VGRSPRVVKLKAKFAVRVERRGEDTQKNASWQYGWDGNLFDLGFIKWSRPKNESVMRGLNARKKLSVRDAWTLGVRRTCRKTVESWDS